MSSLNEHDQQLLETLLNQADAVSPGSEQSEHPEHGGFHTPEHDFRLLDSYINSEMGDDMEPMQFDQQTGSSSFTGSQQSGTTFQQQIDNLGYSTQQQASSSGYGSQKQSTNSGYSSQQQVAGSEYSSQQQAASTRYSSQQQASVSNLPTSSDSNFQNQNAAGFSSQQGGYSAVQSPVQMEQGAAGNYHVQSPGYQQIQGMTSGQGNMGNAENYQTQISSGFDQQYSGGSASLPGQTNPGTSVPTSYSGFTQQFSVDAASPAQNSTGASKESIFQNQLSPYQSQKMQQQSSVTVGHGDQLNQNTESYQQQQTAYQQPGSAHSVQSPEQTFQGGCADGASVHYQTDISGYSQQSVQQHQQQSPAHPNHQGNLNTGFAQQQVASPFQTPSPVPSQVDQSSAAEKYLGQVSKFQSQQSFQSPAGSPCQSDCSFPPSPSAYPQQSPDFGSQQAGKTAGFSSGKIQGFPKQQSFHSPAPSPGQSQMDQSVEASPASYQQPSPGFGSQSHLAFQSAGKSSGGDQQSTGGKFAAQTPTFSLAAQTTAYSPSPGEQTSGSSFQGAASFQQENPDQTDTNISGSFQAQSRAEFTRCFSAQTDQNLAGTYQSQTSGFQHQTFQTHQQSSGHGDHQPMEDGSDSISIDAKASTIFQESLQAQSSGQQDQGMFEYQSSASQFQTAAKSPYQAVPVSQFQSAPANTFQVAPTSQYQGAPASQYSQQAPTSQFQQVESSEFQQTPSYAQREQPMDVQSSQVVASSPSSTFQAFVASSAHSNVFNTTAGEAASTSGSGFLNQTLAFQGQSDGFTVVSSLSAQPNANIAREQSSAVSNAPSGQLSTATSFGQFQSPSSVPFGFNQSSGEQPQHQQPQFQQQQQTQQPGLDHSQQSGNASLVPNSNSQALSTVICDASQFNTGQAAVNQPTQFGGDQFSQQAGIIPVHAVPSGVEVASSFPASAQTLTQGAVGHQNSTPSINSGMEKSPATSLINSNQANEALNLLASLLNNRSLLQGLQGLQALFPPNTQAGATGQLPSSPDTAQSGSVPQVSGGDPNLLEKLLQAHLQQNSQQTVQSPQQTQQHFQQQQQGQLQVQGFQVLQQQQPRQPNFLLQQSSQQPVFLAVQQKEQIPAKHEQPQQQHALQIPSSVISGLSESLGNLGSLGLTMNSDGQLVLRQQGLKIVLQAGAATSTASSCSGTQAPPVMAHSTGHSSMPLTTTVTPSGQTGLQSPSLQTSSRPPGLYGLPSDLQNISVQPLISSAVLPSAAGTHTSMAVPSVVPVVESISSHTSVTPTSSFVHPLPAAGIGSGVVAVSGATSTSNITSDTFTFLTSGSDKPAMQNSQNLVINANSSADTSSIANIFYPVDTSGSYTKPVEASQNNASTPVRNFLNVTTGSASSLLNALKMAVADGNSGVFSAAPASASETIFSDSAKPMETNQGGGKMDSLEMEVGDPAIATSISGRPMETDRPVLDLTSRQSSRKSSMDEDEQKAEANSMLRRILTMKDEDPGAAPSGMLLESPTAENCPVVLSSEMQHDIFTDGNTQSTLIEKSERLQLGSDVQQEDDFQDKMWTFPSGPSTSVEEVVPSKVHKGLDDLDASSVHISVPSVEKLFDAGGATSNSSFVFSKFGTDVPNSVFTFGNSKTNNSITVSTTVTDTRTTSAVVKSVVGKTATVPTASIHPSSRRQKDPSLTYQLPSKVGEYELRILTQPEEQHRARYLTEGSRGAVKDRSQQGYPVIKLLGYKDPATLQIFIGNEAGRVKPHGFYQACKVCGKNSTQCTEREIDGTNVIEIEISPVNDMQVSMDCVGILKLRNADVEKRIGPSKAKAHKKNSTKARLVFRVTIRKPDGSYCTLQTVSSPILCTQPIGQPEISRMSLTELCVNQTSDLFILGKNFLKGTQIHFQELGPDNMDVVWQCEAEIEAEYFQQTHLICRVPSYPKKDIDHPVHVQIVAISGGKTSEPQEFVYKPAMVMVKEEDPMETEPSVSNKALPFGVSPVALQLNRLVERTQHHSTSTSLFQLPPGAVSSIGTATTMSSAPKLVSGSTAQPVTSMLKPAVFTLPTSGQAVFPVASSFGIQERENVKSVPLQLVLPPLGAGQTVTLDSRQLGSQGPQFLVMNPPSSSTSSTITQQAVFTPSGQPVNSTGPAATAASVGSTVTIGATAPTNGQPVSLGQTPTSSAPMIVILTGPPPTGSSGAVINSCCTSNNNNNSNNTTVPLSVQQPASSGQGVVLRFLPYRR